MVLAILAGAAFGIVSKLVGLKRSRAGQAILQTPAVLPSTTATSDNAALSTGGCLCCCLHAVL
jgi:hypothetical protein